MKHPFPIARSLAAAALIIGMAALLSLLSPACISAEWSQRLVGVMLGTVVIVYANAIPKALVAWSRLRVSAAEDQAARRYAGRALVLGGLAYALAWLLAPLQMVAPIGGALLAAALFAAVLRCLRLRANGSAR
jgi:hypothetical protein